MFSSKHIEFSVYMQHTSGNRMYSIYGSRDLEKSWNKDIILGIISLQRVEVLSLAKITKMCRRTKDRSQNPKTDPYIAQKQ